MTQTVPCEGVVSSPAQETVMPNSSHPRNFAPMPASLSSQSLTAACTTDGIGTRPSATRCSRVIGHLRAHACCAHLFGPMETSLSYAAAAWCCCRPLRDSRSSTRVQRRRPRYMVRLKAGRGHAKRMFAWRRSMPPLSCRRLKCHCAPVSRAPSRPGMRCTSRHQCSSVAHDASMSSASSACLVSA